MDRRVAWSPEAIGDVEAIAHWIGRVVPELSDENIRERFVYSYRVIYRVEDDRILVVPVIHGKRLIENVAERFGGTN